MVGVFVCGVECQTAVEDMEEFEASLHSMLKEEAIQWSRINVGEFGAEFS